MVFLWQLNTTYESDNLLGGTGCTGLLIDETGISKKGSASVGVSRQWNDRLGKVDNCQVGVFGALCAGDRVIPVDAELFLPSSWIGDPVRYERSGVPAERMHHRTKPELALDIIRRQRELGVRFDYVSADGLYGNSTELCRALDDDTEIIYRRRRRPWYRHRGRRHFLSLHGTGQASAR